MWFAPQRRIQQENAKTQFRGPANYFAQNSPSAYFAENFKMQSQKLGASSLSGSRLAYGCWRLPPNDYAAGKVAIRAAWDAGYRLFDNADVYGRGEAEKILGAALREISEMRAGAVVLTKCGVRHAGDPNPASPNRWDFSAEHIVSACEQSLKRLGVETIDILMLHRPDFLADPEEIAGAFTELKSSGKVRFFGVSNFRPMLVTALQAACPMPLIAHQVEISLAKLDAFTDGTLDQCLIERITPMAWSPLAGGMIGGGAGRLLPAQQIYRPEKFLPELEAVAAGRGVTRTAVALAWLLKHPARIVPIIGSIQPQRIREAVAAAGLELTREEWYRLLTAARGEPLP